jgi:hypothetical protein
MHGVLPSGLWTGHYEQFQHSYPQQATLEFADGLIRGDGVDGIGVFHIEGEYRVDERAIRMGWIKTYERAHSVLYLGVLQGEVIAGSWELPGYSGKFALRPARRTVEGAR